VDTNFGNERGIASVEYGLIIGIAVLATAALVAGSAQQVAGMWHRTNTTVGFASASSTPAKSIPCNRAAHPNSKICDSESR
jgi:Flp pilus assembly pilin Flp